MKTYFKLHPSKTMPDTWIHTAMFIPEGCLSGEWLDIIYDYDNLTICLQKYPDSIFRYWGRHNRRPDILNIVSCLAQYPHHREIYTNIYQFNVKHTIELK